MKLNPPSGLSYVPSKADTWIAAWVYSWSEVYDGWLDRQLSVTVKPNDTPNDAYMRRFGETIPNDTHLFYNKD